MGQSALRVAVKSGRTRLLDQVVEVFPCTEQVGTGLHGGISTTLRGMIAARIELEAAGLSNTRDNLVALGHRELKSWKRDYSDIEVNTKRYRLKCEAEVARLKSHMLNDTMSLHAFMLTDNIHCISSKNLLNSHRNLYYDSYFLYEDFLKHKSEKFELMVSAVEGFNLLLKAGGTSGGQDSSTSRHHLSMQFDNM